MRCGGFVIAIVSLLSLPYSAQAIELKGVQAVQGRFGPERPNLEVQTDDEVLFRYIVVGAKTDANGSISAEWNLQIFDVNDKQLLNEKKPLKGVIALAGGTYPGNVTVTFGPKSTPGEYRVVFTLHDRIADESASFERILIVKPSGFVIKRPRFSYDAEGKIDAPAGGVLGQTLFVRFQVAGFDKKKKKIDVHMKLQILDEKGKELMPNPLHRALTTEDADEVEQATVLNFSANLALNRTGKYRLRIQVEDKLGKKTSEFVTPLLVTAP